MRQLSGEYQWGDANIKRKEYSAGSPRSAIVSKVLNGICNTRTGSAVGQQGAEKSWEHVIGGPTALHAEFSFDSQPSTKTGRI